MLDKPPHAACPDSKPYQDTVVGDLPWTGGGALRQSLLAEPSTRLGAGVLVYRIRKSLSY